MITAIDSNILIDIFNRDPNFGEKSLSALRKCLQEGAVQVCEIVWIEVTVAFSEEEKFLQVMREIDIEFSAINQDSALVAAKAWKQYRKNGGKREKIIADFLIGAHAVVQSDRLLTRDRGFYREYFKTLKIINPAIA